MKSKLSLLLLLALLTACDTPSSLKARVTQPDATLRATVVAGASGSSLRVIQTDQLPADLRTATEIRAILDNSNTTYPVTRNADGSLSIPLPAGRQPDSQGQLEIMLTDGKRSYLLRFDTGPLLRLGATPISVSPANQVLVGSELTLKANITETADLSPYVFSWSAASSAQGPFVPLSGNGASVRWQPAAAGNYYLRLEMRDTRSGASSVFTTPAAAVFVNAADTLVSTEPADGRVLAGDKIKLTANVPELRDVTSWQWSFSQSPVGPFQPISGQSASISWEPPAAGSYYLRLQALANGQQHTYTTSRAVVLVANADEVIKTSPASGGVTRGQSVSLTATVPNTDPTWRHIWSYATSSVGPFTAIAAEGASISWSPDATGEFFLRVRVLNPINGEEKVYTSSKSLVSVRDSDDRFALSPRPASLVKGQSLNLSLADRGDLSNRTINWFYAPSPAGPFLAIPGQGQNVRWAPPAAGTYYLRAEVTGGGTPKSTFTSASALVSVSEASGVIGASPEGSVQLGRPVRLSARLPEADTGAKYSWSLGPSPAGPWQSVQSFADDPRTAELDVYPAASGNYYVKVDVTSSNGGVISFVSPRAMVFVSHSRDFLTTSPSPALIGTEGAVTLNASFQPPSSGAYTYSWSSGLSAAGPFTALGGSITPRFSWVRPGVAGNYFIKLDVLAPNRRGVSFVSSDAIVFAGESQTVSTFTF